MDKVHYKNKGKTYSSFLVSLSDGLSSSATTDTPLTVTKINMQLHISFMTAEEISIRVIEY